LQHKLLNNVVSHRSVLWMTLVSLIHQISQANATQEPMDLIAQVLPQMMSQTHLTLMAVAFALTVGDIDRLINRIDDLGDKNACSLARQPIAASRAPNTCDKVTSAQFGKELL
jgi:hypothetical protein